MLNADRFSTQRPEFVLTRHRQFLECRHARRPAAHGPLGLRRNEGLGKGRLNYGRRLVVGKLTEQAWLRRHWPDRNFLIIWRQCGRNRGGRGLIDGRPQSRQGRRLRDPWTGTLLLGALNALRDAGIVGLEALGEFSNSRFMVLGRFGLAGGGRLR